MTNRQLLAVHQALAEARDGTRPHGPLARLLAEKHLPGLAESLKAALPMPTLKAPRKAAGGRANGQPQGAPDADAPSVIALAEALAAACAFCRANGHAREATAAEAGVLQMLERNILSYDREVLAHIDTVDLPDLRRISLIGGRIDVLCWVAETLEARETLKTLSFHGRRAVRLTLARVCAILDRFLSDRTLESRFDTIAVTMELDELVVSVERLLDPEVVAREGGAAFLGDRDAEVTDRLASSLRLLLSVLIKMLRNAGHRPDSAIDLALGVIRQIERLLLLGSSLEAALPDSAFSGMVKPAMADLTRALLELEMIDRPDAERLARTVRATLTLVSQARLSSK